MSGGLGVVVLAGEQSEAMVSDMAPALHRVAGTPAAQYVIDAARRLDPATVVVVGEQQGQGEGALSGADAYLAGPRELFQSLGECEATLFVWGDTPLLDPSAMLAVVKRREETRAKRAYLTSAGGDDVAVCVDTAWLVEQDPRGESFTAWLVERAESDRSAAATVAAGDEASLRLVNRQALALAEGLVRERLIARHQEAGVTFRDPYSVYVDRGVRLEADVVLEPNCYLYGETSVATGAVVGPGATLRNASIGAGSRVEHSVVEDSTVGEGTTVGPFAHVRGGAAIGDGCEIHNYAEVKNSVVGDGVKMHHFSYLGDADVGEGANIGAGAVTVNFDGTEKHRTHIGNRAFVGCDTMLIAPVSVGDGAFTAAGAVVTRDVEPGVRVAGVPARALPAKEEES
ncbi:MAG: NTP transferase domain-containing protein [Chloroflexi bacterium]|nr:NTP transferase domain-containing protein [Chloroflexota bacterium]